MQNEYYHNEMEKKKQHEYYDNQLQNRVQMINPGSSDSPYYPDMHQFVHPQMNSINRNLQIPMQYIQMNPQMVDHRLAAFEQENISSQMNEGYLSPASAIAQGWTPQIVYVPSPMIHMIPSPMPSSMIPSPSLPPMNYITQEAMDRFTHMNSGLGLLNPEINPENENQELVQLPFEDMLSSLGLLPVDNTNVPLVQSGQTRSKGKNRALYKCPWAGCEKSNSSTFNI
jgi:hypothetical protein